VFTIGHQAALTHSFNISLVEIFKEELERLSGGTMTCDIQGAGAIGQDVELRTMIHNNELDAAVLMSWGIYHDLDERANFDSLPFVFDSMEEAWAAYDGELGKWVASNILEPLGSKVIGYWMNGIRHYTNNVRPLNTPADMNGLRMRSPQVAIHLQMYEACGAVAFSMPLGQLYEALQEGRVDGQDNPLSNIYSQKFHEVQNYLSLSRHMYTCGVFVVSGNFWNSLTAEQQGFIVEAERKAAVWARERDKANDEELLQTIRAFGTSVNEINTAAFRQAVEPIWEDHMGRLGNDFARLAKNYINDTGALAHKYGN
jgi:tripartite ATP-independent transporter DctP family solute receptor